VEEAYVCVVFNFGCFNLPIFNIRKLLNLICMVEFNEGVRRNGERKVVKVLC
jgi:hypothetical protein